MNSLKIDRQTKECFFIAAGSFLLWQVGMILRATSLINIYFIKRVLDIFPNFILSIAIPFGLLALIHFLKMAKNETRLFYYIIYTLLSFVIFGGYILTQYFFISFDIYNIIGTFIALFIDMIIQSRFEIKMMKME